jgi:hypothetical protein
MMTVCISDKAEEFRIEIAGLFMAGAVAEAATAWKAALLVNAPRRVCVDITRMSGYDHAGYKLLREMHAHGTHIGAGTPRSLYFLNEISGPAGPVSELGKRGVSKQLATIKLRATAAGE